MTLSAVRSHVHQSLTSLSALEAVLQDLRDGDLPPCVLERALAELAEVSARLDALADQLAEGFDPAAAGR
jgi:hypothetical protein